MGCGSVQEKLETKIMNLKMEKVLVDKERHEYLNALKGVTGIEYTTKPIPDYISHEKYIDNIMKNEVFDYNKSIDMNIINNPNVKDDLEEGFIPNDDFNNNRYEEINKEDNGDDLNDVMNIENNGYKTNTRNVMGIDKRDNMNNEEDIVLFGSRDHYGNKNKIKTTHKKENNSKNVKWNNQQVLFKDSQAQNLIDDIKTVLNNN